MTATPTPTSLCVVRQPAKPGTAEWARIITASKVAGIAGESAYETPYSVWNMLNGIRVDDSSMEDRFLTGHAMEHALAYWWAERNPEWRLSSGEVQVQNPHLGFDNAATLDRVSTMVNRSRGPRFSRCVQFKTVRDWEEFQNLTPETLPVDWLIQETWEMLCSGLVEHPAIIVVAGPYYEWREFEVPYVAEFAADLVASVRDFIATLDGQPPTPTAPNDYRIAKLRHPDIDDDADPVAVDADLAAAWDRAKTASKDAAAAKRAADKDAELAGARLLEEKGRTAVAIDPDGHVLAKRVATKRGVQLRHVPLPKAVAA